MPGPREFTNHEECAGAVLDLAGAVDVLRQTQLAKWPDHDIRVVALQNSQDHLFAVAMLLNVLDKGAKHQVDFPGLVGLTTGEPQIAAEILTGFAQRSMIPMVQFQIENLMSRVLAGVGVKPPRSFEKLATQFLSRAGVNAPQRKASWMYVPSLMRNTLHNNGLHEGGRNRQMTVNGYSFRFRLGRPFRQAGFHHILWAFRAEIEILGEALTAGPFSIGDVIADPYAQAVTRRGH